MKIIITEDAKKLLEKREVTNVMLEVKDSKSWSGLVLKPVVTLGKPLELENFSVQEIDGINVYIMNGIKAKNDTIEIITEKFIFMENLTQSGILV